MKPSVQDATHYDRIFNVWYKTGETIAHYWDYDKKGWARSAFEREDLENEGEIITAQEALEQGYKYPQYPTTTQGVIVDSSSSGEVLGPVTHLVPDMTEANDKKVNTTSANNRQVGGDHYKKMKIQPWAADEAWLTHEQFVGHLLGSAIDYLARFNADAPGKGGIRDIEKAKHCLEKLIEVKRGAANADVTDKH